MLPLRPPILREVDLPKPGRLQDLKTHFEDILSCSGRRPHHPAACKPLRILLANIQRSADRKGLAAADHAPVQADHECFHGLPFISGRRSGRADVKRHPHNDAEAASPESPLCGNTFHQWHQNLPSLPVCPILLRYHSIRRGTCKPVAASGGSPDSVVEPRPLPRSGATLLLSSKGGNRSAQTIGLDLEGRLIRKPGKGKIRQRLESDERKQLPPAVFGINSLRILNADFSPACLVPV